VGWAGSLGRWTWERCRTSLTIKSMKNKNPTDNKPRAMRTVANSVLIQRESSQSHLALEGQVIPFFRDSFAMNTCWNPKIHRMQPIDQNPLN
jgi:hypothetical protein